jgi:hypothetical protein
MCGEYATRCGLAIFRRQRHPVSRIGLDRGDEKVVIITVHIGGLDRPFVSQDRRSKPVRTVDHTHRRPVHDDGGELAEVVCQ